MNVRTVHVKMAQTVLTKDLDITASAKPDLRAKIVKMVSIALNLVRCPVEVSQYSILSCNYLCDSIDSISITHV